MAQGRNRCVIQDVTPTKGMPHNEFVSRIRKTLYYGRRTSYQGMAVSRPLAFYASELFSEPHRGYSLNRLTEETAGAINASPCALIMALIYLDRLNTTDPAFVRRITPSELFIVSLVISTKFYFELDEQAFLKTCAKESDISEEHIKKLELEFLFAIDWNIYISEEEFFDKLAIIEKTIAKKEGIKRGWLTYTELINFLPSFTIAKFLLSNIAVMAVSYAASVMTIAGAFFLVSHITGSSLIKGNAENVQRTELCTDTANLNNRFSNIPVQHNIEESPNVPLSIPDYEEEMKKLRIEFSDDVEVSKNQNQADYFNLGKSIKVDMEQEIYCYNFIEEGNFIEIKNGTESNLWTLLRNDKSTFIEFPFTWFKFI